MPRSGWLAIGVVGGALAIDQARGAPGLVLLLALVGGLVASWAPARVRRIGLAAAIGLAAICLRMAIAPGEAMSSGAPTGDGPWRLVVETVGTPRKGDQTAILRGPWSDGAAFRLAATLPRYPPVEPGDVVDVTGRTRPRPDSAFGAYLERQGAWGTLDADGLAIVGRLDGPATALEHWRRVAGDALTIGLPEPEAGLAAGILIGLRDRVDRAVAADFTTAGVSHVVAISGWNIAIVAAAIAALAGRLGRRRRAVITVVAIATYIAAAGASPSVLRAGAMAGIVLLARESGRAGHAASALGWAAALLVLAVPTMVTDAGFQLSTLATAGLIAWATPLTAWLDRLGRGRLPAWLAESLGVSLAAQAATLPIVLLAFGRLAVIAPLVNLLVVPLVAPAMAAGVVALAAGLAVSAGAPGALATIASAPAWVALRLMIAIVEATARLPFAAVTLEPAMAVFAASLATAGIATVAVRRRHRPRTGTGTALVSPGPAPGAALAGGTAGGPAAIASARKPRTMGSSSAWQRAATIALVTSLAVTGAVVVVRPPPGARITVLDVGQGDAILVEGGRGGRLLVDGGPDPERLLVVLDRHLPPWDRRIDAVILSHPHEDHVAGLALLLDRYRVGRVFEPGMRGPGPGYAAWAARLSRPGAPIRLGLATGDRLAVDDVAMRVLWPDRGTVPAEPPDTGTGINNVSIVLLGEVGGRRFLLTGDIEQGVDPVVLARGLRRVDVLKVAHHGSRTATTQAFVDATRPAIAVASAGTGNPYGHPTKATLDRLRASGARVYRTDRDGSVTIGFDAAGFSVRTEARSAAGAVTPTTRAVAAVIPPVPSLARTFVCAVPVRDGGGGRGPSPERDTDAGEPDAPGPAARALAAAGPTRRLADPRRPDDRLGYHRPDDDPCVSRGDRDAVLPDSPGLRARARLRASRRRSLRDGRDDRAVAVRVGRRRPARGPPRGALRHGARRGTRHAARALGRARRADGGSGDHGDPR